jgi:hypothetical protein
VKLKKAGTSRTLAACAVLLVCGKCGAQERCSAEVKLLLSPAEMPATLAALKAKKESSGEVYFYDTEKRELLSQGVIVRLRSGSDRDLTVKLRRGQDEKYADPTGGKENYKCEVDVAGNLANTSYSIRNKFSGAGIPETGSEVYGALSKGQRKLLSAAQVRVDWEQVKRIVEIKATDWQIKADSGSKKLALELWEWPGGKILEVSSKVGSGEGEAAYEELRRVVADKGLRLNVEQRSKTRMVLEPRTSTTAE